MVVRCSIAVVLSAALLCEADAEASPLHEIAPSTQNATVCGNVVVHANAAIADTLRNDATLARIRGLLHTANFDPTVPTHGALLAEITRGVRDVASDMEHGVAETKRLREYADHPAGEDRAEDVRAFADMLDAGLAEQRKATEVIAAFMATTQGSDLQSGVRPLGDSRNSDFAQLDASTESGRLPASSIKAGILPMVVAKSTVSQTDGARKTADDLDRPFGAIVLAETRAASHAERAVGGC